jgi:ATP-dependent RNA helicase RhlE
MSFASLGLSDALLRAVADAGYTQPTPIQLQAIPAVLAGGDLLAGAQTGTGKTAGFVLPILQRLSTAPREGAKAARAQVRVLILTPTRELAAQVEESVRTYGKHLNFKSAVVYGGVGFNPQVEALRRGVDILVATPGRLLDHQRQRTVDLSGVETLVLDEADRMLDMGFIPDIKRILALLPKKRQNLLFSATFSDEIRDLANGLLHSPAQIQVTPRNSTVDTIRQTVHPVDPKRKTELLVHLVKDQQWFQVLVFTRTKHGANRLAEQLGKNGITALAIHGNKSQGARTRALAEFKSAKLQVLVATDIAARGLDIDQLPHVVNFDIPNVPEDYVHRIGRTGRAGASGEAVSLVGPDEMGYLRDIERLIKQSITRVAVAGFDAGTATGIEPARAARTAPRAPRPSQRAAKRPQHAAKPSQHTAKPSQRAAKPSQHAAKLPQREPKSPQRAPRPNGVPSPGAPAEPVHAGRERPSAAKRSGSPRKPAAVVDPLVRSNLPAGWTMKRA